MKESQIFATSLLIAFPLTMIFFGSEFAVPTKPRDLTILEGFSVAKLDSGPNGLNPIALDCNDAKIQEVRATATRSASYVTIDCNLRLTRRDTITKRMKFEGTSANGVTVNCNGATINGGDGSINYRYRDSLDMIEVKSIPLVDGETWKRPENITIKNCAIIGSVMISIGSIRPRDTKRPGYVDRIRANAPKNIVLDHATITGIAGDIVYFGGGVTYSQLVNSEIKGTSTGVPLYLDAESYKNTIKNDSFTMVTRGREVMAVDGSSYNTITDNWFSGINHGGIYLYRNCGGECPTAS